MTKVKEQARKRQKGLDAITKEILPTTIWKYDGHRIVPKRNNGAIELKNIEALKPVTNMKVTGNYRERKEQINKLKSKVDDRESIIKAVLQDQNRLMAYKRSTDILDEMTLEFLEHRVYESKEILKKKDKQVQKQLDLVGHPIVSIANNVAGIGKMTIAYMLVYVDISKCNYAGNLWSYVGIVKPSYERYSKGESSGGCKPLRVALHRTATSIIRMRGRTEMNKYIEVYDREKLRLSKSRQITKSRNRKGELKEMAWKDTMKSHRHGAAIRKVIKHICADWWFVHRTLEGLPTPEPYVMDYLGHKNWIRPEERGWKIHPIK